MNANYHHYYSVIKKISSLSGHWPYQKSMKNLINVVLITLGVISIVIPQIAKSVKCNGSMECIFETTTAHVLSFLILVKLYACYFNRCKMKIIIDQLVNDWNELETPQEYEIMTRYAKNTRRYIIVYFVFWYVTLYVNLSICLIPQMLDAVLPLNESRSKLQILPAYYFVDENKYYYYILLHAVLAYKFISIGTISHDCLLLTVVEHICSIFALSGFRFEQIICNNTVNVFHPHTCDVNRKKIALFVHAHLKALKLTQLMEDAFSSALALEVASNTIMISVTLLQITKQDANILHKVRNICYVVGQLVHLFCFCFEGQKLINHSIQTRDKIYNSVWYETSTKWQKMILFVMHKSLEPVSLSAAKIFIFSMENFSTVLQTSMSYFTVLSSID